MEKVITPCLLCVFLFFVALSVRPVYATNSEQLEFFYQNKVFTYTLNKNIKTSSQFDLNYEINKYNRFSSTDNRIELLKLMSQKGFDKEISLNYLFPHLTELINKIEKNVFIAPKDAQIDLNPSSEKVFNIRPEVVGISLDRQTLIDNIYKNYTTKQKLYFNIPIKKTNPKQTKQQLQEFTHLRSDFSTNISSSTTDRKHNIKNALNSLNKIEIAPNEIFSFNKTVGRRTAENGYRQAKIIVNNEFVDGIGGGVCQVSSSLYNAALLAGLEIVEANKHSKQVSYVRPGFDAMVNFGSSDLKFKNNTSKKITIITNYSSSTARIRIFGETKNSTSYKLINEISNIVEPIEEIFIDEKREHADKVLFEDEFYLLKKGSRGMEIKTYRETYVDNNLISKELLRHDKFKVQNTVKVYGTQKRTYAQEKSTEQICA